MEKETTITMAELVVKEAGNIVDRNKLHDNSIHCDVTSLVAYMEANSDERKMVNQAYENLYAAFEALNNCLYSVQRTYSLPALMR